MLRVNFKKIAACVLLAGATAGLCFSAGNLRLSPEQLAALEAEEEAAAAEEEAEPVVFTEAEVPEEAPAPDDLEGRLQTGDFAVLADASPERLQELEEVYRDARPRSRYLHMDVNGDGTQELLWLAGGEDEKAEAVIAVFAREKDAERLILWDPVPDDDCYAAGRDGLVYIRKNEWIISEFHCTNVLFDREYDMYAGDGIFLYIVDDEDAYLDGVDAALRRRMEDVDGRGVWYYALETGADIEQAMRIDATEWLERFHFMTGSTLQYVSPSIEEIRSGVASDVARSAYVVRRADGSYEEAVYYPQLTGAGLRESVNNVLKDAAFVALMNGYTDVKENETPEAYLMRKKEDPSVMRTAETSFRLVSDTDTLLSVLYRTRRGTDGSFDKTELSFLTIDKQSGRQLQIGDMANADTIARAVAEGSAELFYASGDDVVFERDEDPAHDVEWMSGVLQRTRESGDVWKKAGLDEQFLFMIVITDPETGSEAILRIPRWKVGMSTPGHMELLTWHEAYPFLRGTLDMASSLTVRKNPGGFLINYRTDEGGRVSMDLRDTTEELPAPGTSPEESRDFFDRYYEDMTGFAVGTFESSDGTGDFYATEVNRGTEGTIFLRTGDNRYVITQSRAGTRDGVSGVRMAGNTGSGLTVAGSLQTDSTGASTWRNHETGQLTLKRRVTLEELFTFTLFPAGSAATDGYGLLEIASEGGAGGAVQFPLSGRETVYTFRDINLDGFIDFTVGVIDEADHGREQNFFYHAGLNRYVEGPEELQRDVPYSFDAETGYALVGDGETEQTLYAFDETGVFRELRKLERTPDGDAVSLVMTAPVEAPGWWMEEDTDTAAEEIILQDTLTGEELESALRLFRSEFVWRGVLLPEYAEETDLWQEAYILQEEDPDAVTAEPEPEHLQVIVTRRHAADIIRPLEMVYVYLLTQDGTLIGSMSLPASESRLLYVEPEGISYDDTLMPEGALLIQYAEEPAAEPEPEPDTENPAAAMTEDMEGSLKTVTVRELLAETGYGRD